MIEIKKYNPSIKRPNKSNKLINFIAIFVIFAGSFIFSSSPTYAKQLNTCKGGGASCSCVGPCTAGTWGCKCE